MEKTIVLDDDLVREAQELTGASDEREAVESILRSSIRVRRKNRDLLAMAGKVEFFEGYDPKKLRFSRHDPD